MGPGLRWDAHLETGIGWCGTRMELGYNSAVEKGPGWKWDTKATITHWRFLLENRRNTANLRTVDERHKIWRFCFHFHGITAAVRQDTLSCAPLRQQYDQGWSSGGSVAVLVRKPHALSRLHDAQSRFAAFVGAHTRCSYVHWCSSALWHHLSRSLAEGWHFCRSHTIKWKGGVPSRHNAPNPRYFFPGGRSMKTSPIPRFLHIAARVWGQHWNT